MDGVWTGSKGGVGGMDLAPTGPTGRGGVPQSGEHQASTMVPQDKTPPPASGQDPFPFKCHSCFQAFPTMALLNRHRHPPGPPPYPDAPPPCPRPENTCGNCGRGFWTNALLKQHLSPPVPCIQLRPFRCSQCGQVFRSHLDMVTHVFPGRDSGLPCLPCWKRPWLSEGSGFHKSRDEPL